MNYNVFFPIQLYKNEHLKKFRITPPSLSLTTPYDYRFESHFIDDIETTEREKYRKEWKYYRTIWVLNPKYEFFMLPGVIWCLVTQNTDAPYETKFISTDYFNLSDKKYQFIFGSMINPVPDTVLACFYLDNKEILTNIVLMDENTEDITTNILPFKKNKDIPFYNLFSDYSHRYFYVYTEEPTSTYWKIKNNICVPEKDGYASYFDCLNASVDQMRNRQTYLHDPLIPLTTYFSDVNNKPDVRIISVWILIVIIGLLLLWLIFLSIKSNLSL